MLDYVQHGDDIEITSGGSEKKFFDRARVGVDLVSGPGKFAILGRWLHAIDRKSGASHGDEEIAARASYVQKRTVVAKPKHKVPNGAIKTLLAIASPGAFEIEPGIELAELSI